MSFAANTWVQVVRPDQAPTDDYGDPVPTPAPEPDAPKFKASLIETTRMVMDETTGTLRTIRYANGRVVRNRPNLQENDVLTDVRTGKTWVVDQLIDIPHTIGGTSDVRVVLRDTSGE